MRLPAFVVCVIGLSFSALAQQDEFASTSPYVVAERPAQPMSIESSRKGRGGSITESFDTIERLPFLPPPLAPLEHLPFADTGCLLRFDPAFGVVDQAAALSSPTYNGPVEGPDPENARGGMLHVQRASVIRPAIAPNSSESIYEWSHDIVTPNVLEGAYTPYFVTFDVYKNSHGDFQIFRPISYSQSAFVTGILAGGTFAPSNFFRTFSERYGNPEVTEGVVVLGIDVMPNEPGRFYMNTKQIPEGGWYTIGLLVSDRQLSVWVRDAETRGELASPPSATPVRSGGAFDGQRMFSEFGFGLEQGWAQVFPGLEDDPATPDVIEGYGLAESTNGVLAGAFADPNGNVAGEIWTTSYLDAMRIQAGGDPDPADFPEYEIRDWWIDEFAIRGAWVFEFTCVGDLGSSSTVDSFDLALLLARWGASGGREDLNCDGVVDAADLAILLAAWGDCP